MPKRNDEEILKEISEIEKQFLLQELKNVNVTEITKYEYEKHRGLNDEDNWEKIVIIRKPKKLNLTEKE